MTAVAKSAALSGAGAGCGSCTLCCTVMRVDMEPPKPAGQTCPHCSIIGCSIYSTRPEACSGFQCLWLASQKVAQLALPAAMRPDRCGFVIDLNAAGTVLAHCAAPDSWTLEPGRSWLLDKARRTNVILEFSDGAIAKLLAADGSTEDLARVGVDPTSNNRLYVRRSELAKYRAQAPA